jgi:raffinose/stachyose/melibiose transport system substrate-binding protein
MTAAVLALSACSGTTPTVVPATGTPAAATATAAPVATATAAAATPTAAAETPTAAPPTETPTEPAQAVTLRVLSHANPPFNDYMTKFDAAFHERHPNITVDHSVVAPADLATTTQSRLNANDVDVIDMFAFANSSQPYMKDVTPPVWQSLIDAGLLMDLTGQPFLANYDASTIADAGTYNGKVYEINLARVGFSGLYYNKKLFADNNVTPPTTWSELVAACQTFKAASVPCITVGGKDVWPVFVTGYGLLGSAFPDQSALVEGLWTGTIKYNDAKFLDLWKKFQVLARDMIKEGASGIAADGAPGDFAAGNAAMLSGFTWLAPAIDAAAPDFEWGFINFPGSDTADDNKYLFGKYDQGWTIAANTPNKDASLLYLSEFSDPTRYQEFVTAVGAIPTQPTATLDTTLGHEIADDLANFRIGWELYWVAPKGAGDHALPYASFFTPFGDFDDPQALADKAQEDLDAGLSSSQ